MSTTKFLLVLENPAQHRKAVLLALARTRRRKKRVTISSLYEQAMREYLRRTG